MKACGDSYKGRFGFPQGAQKPVHFMSANEIPRGAKEFHSVSAGLDTLAELLTPISKAFSMLLGSLRNTVALL